MDLERRKDPITADEQFKLKMIMAEYAIITERPIKGLDACDYALMITGKTYAEKLMRKYENNRDSDKTSEEKISDIFGIGNLGKEEYKNLLTEKYLKEGVSITSLSELLRAISFGTIDDKLSKKTAELVMLGIINNEKGDYLPKSIINFVKYYNNDEASKKANDLYQGIILGRSMEGINNTLPWEKLNETQLNFIENYLDNVMNNYFALIAAKTPEETPKKAKAKKEKKTKEKRLLFNFKKKAKAKSAK
jgi:hypothetical protein